MASLGHNELRGIFLNESLYDLIQGSLKFVPGGSIENYPILIQVMTWCCQAETTRLSPGDNKIAWFLFQLPSHSVISHELHGISNHQKLNWFFNNLFRLTTKKKQSSVLMKSTTFDQPSQMTSPCNMALHTFIQMTSPCNMALHTFISMPLTCIFRR